MPSIQQQLISPILKFYYEPEILGVESNTRFIAKIRLAILNRYHFTRHLSVIQNGYKRGEYEQQSIHRRI